MVTIQISETLGWLANQGTRLQVGVVSKKVDLRPELQGLWFATLSGGPVKSAITGYGRSLENAVNDVIDLHETARPTRGLATTGGKRRAPARDRVKHIRRLGRGL